MKSPILNGLCMLTLAATWIGLAHGNAQSINPGIVDPTNIYAGKTYSQWSAAFWQYLMSLPTTNNPLLLYDSTYPIAPLHTAQTGPVWFISGRRPRTVPIVQSTTNTIPGGTALFLEI